MELQGAVNFRSVHVRVHYFSFKSEHEERKSEVVRSVSATKVEGKISSCSLCAFEQNLYLHVAQLFQQKKQNKNPESVQWSRSGWEKSRCTEPAELRWRLTVNMLTIRDSSCPSSHILCHTPLTEREEAGWLCCFWLLYAAWYRQDINPTSFPAIRRYGKDFTAIAEVIGTKTPAQVSFLFLTCWKCVKTTSRLILTSPSSALERAAYQLFISFPCSLSSSA